MQLLIPEVFLEGSMGLGLGQTVGWAAGVGGGDTLGPLQPLACRTVVILTTGRVFHSF